MLHQVQHIAITFDDGTIGVMQFILDPRLPEGIKCEGYLPEERRREATDAAIQSEVDKSAFAPRKPVRWRRIAAADVPAERAYRAAWRDDGGAIVHDMAHCRDIHRSRLRELRAPLLEALDVQYQRADEREDRAEKRRIAEAKQALRDATHDPRIDAAQSIEDLRAVTL